MKKKNCIHIIILFFISCTAQNKEVAFKESYKEAINNAVIDFLKISSLVKKDTIFYVSYKELTPQVIGVSIIGTKDKFYIDGDKPVNRLPTNYIEYKNKLFYWYNNNTEFNKESIINKLKEYKVIEYDAEIFERSIDDNKQGVNYYFCRNDLSVYKKEKTNLPISNIPPKLSCE